MNFVIDLATPTYFIQRRQRRIFQPAAVPGFIVLISDGIEVERKNKDITGTRGILFRGEHETKWKRRGTHSSRVINRGNKRPMKNRLEDRIS